MVDHFGQTVDGWAHGWRGQIVEELVFDDLGIASVTGQLAQVSGAPKHGLELCELTDARDRHCTASRAGLNAMHCF
jgi:hypothetical protein